MMSVAEVFVLALHSTTCSSRWYSSSRRESELEVTIRERWDVSHSTTSLMTLLSPRFESVPSRDVPKVQADDARSSGVGTLSCGSAWYFGVYCRSER